MDVITSYHWRLLSVTLCRNRVKGSVISLQLYSKHRRSCEGNNCDRTQILLSGPEGEAPKIQFKTAEKDKKNGFYLVKMHTHDCA